MLHIVLLILKIIGIVLLCIIGLLLLAIVCVLFVPVRYKIKVVREEGEDNPPVTAYVKITWLLHLLNVLIRYTSKITVRARILVFTIFKLPRKEKSGKKQSTQTIPQDVEDAVASAVSEDYTAFGGEEGEHADREKQEEFEDEENASLFDKIKAVFTMLKQIVEKIKDFIQNIQYTIRKFCDKIKSVSDNIQYYREVIESDSFCQSFGLCKDELLWILKKIRPDKFEADVIVGMSDPAATGDILAVYGMLYPLIGQHVRIVGDFESEKPHIEGWLYIHGKIRAFTFLRTAVRVYFNKDIKKLIRLLKKEAA